MFLVRKRFMVCLSICVVVWFRFEFWVCVVKVKVVIVSVVVVNRCCWFGCLVLMVC